MTWVRFCGPGGRDAAGYGKDACRYRSVAMSGGTLLKVSMQIQLDKMHSSLRLVLLTNDVPNFKPEPRN
jgi:hypothetical protein